MIKEARGFGSTVEEAREKARINLNVSDDADVQFEIIVTAKKKVLGLFGGRQAEIRAYIELPDEKPKAHKKNNSKPQNKSVRKPEKAEQKKSEAPVKQAAEKAAAKPQEKAEEAVKPKTSKASEAYSGFGDAVDVSQINPETKAGKAAAYLKNILEKLGCTEITMKIAEKENAALISLDGEGLGVVIGHRGETLDSLQYLTGLAANNGGGYYKVSLNIGDYREKREEALINLANRVAAQVIKTGKNRSLEPMNPYERRIIHTAVQNIEGVVSNSYGEGSGRRVVIAVEGGDTRPPRRDSSRRDNRYGKKTSKPSTPSAPAREPKKDSDTPLYGKIN